MLRGDIEALAESLLDSLHLDRVTCARTTAELCGFTVAEVDTKSCVLGDVICVQRSRPERQNFAVLHELAHAVLRHEGVEDHEHYANLLASALLLPRRDFKRSLRNLGWDFRALKSEYPAASFEAIGRRICAVSDATLWARDVSQGLVYEWQAGRRRKRPPEVTEALDWLCTTSEPWHSPSAVRVEVEGWIRAIAIH